MTNTNRHRRLTQFSLRSLLLLMTIVAAYTAGWLSNEWRHKQNAPSPQAATVPVVRPPIGVLKINTRPIPKWIRPDPIEQGMKIDELEMKERIDKALQKDGSI